jgi:class 3 adenylate cyclase/tetratricopeptide (TPR) repeat protein/energy-coupling factor transporter ATP-binding protein EcfA2
MASCSRCGQDNPQGFRFCGACGTPLAAAGGPSDEERKVVTVLFCDLVGFTARSDQADPEDVGAMLRPYHARLRREIERFGGTLDKFIGDAVMAVFGAPTAHEDDPERAVRCAARLLEAIAELNERQPALALSVRIGITTGEVLVALRPGGETEGVVGDIVNTASRLQGVAPVNGILVGEGTWRATRAQFDYEDLEPVRVKGKTQPVPVWRLAGARSRLGVDVDQRAVTPFVGRRAELDLLERCYVRALRERSVQLVTLLGEPGAGKSRLVHELAQLIDDRQELVTWRQGRCLPYGEGITFWALGEIVKAQAGILESDPPAQVAAKLDGSLQALVDRASERDWLRVRLGSLLGLAGGEGPRVDQAELFAACRRFVEAMAARGPLVLVIEDLHWGDTGLLQFLDYLVGTLTGVTLLVVATARPELLDRHPGWSEAWPNATSVALPPLTDAETAALIAALLGQPMLPAEVQAPLLERAGGNPLYAEEFARLLTDRGLLVRDDRGVRLSPDQEIPFPETVQALVAARLDTLPPDRKAIVQDAAVVGKVFWPGALAALGGGDEQAVQAELHELERMEFIRAARASSVEGQPEYAFWHAVIGDVAYTQIPRARRTQRHQAAAEWLERLAGERVADRAEIIAHHYSQAAALARATGDRGPRLAELEERARRFLVLAGGRTLALDVGRARRYYQQALALCPPDHPQRPQILVGTARAAFQSGHVEEAAAAYEEAIAGSASHGDVRGQVEALNRLCTVLWHQGETSRSRAVLSQGIKLLEREPPSPELCFSYTQMAADRVLSGHSQEALPWADKAIALAERLGGLPEVKVQALDYRGMARCDLNDFGGLDDLRQALRLAHEIEAANDAAVLYNSLVAPLWLTEGPASALETCRAGIDFAERRGLAQATMSLRGSSLAMLADLGRWDEVLRLADEVIVSDRAHGGRYESVAAEIYKAVVWLWRGEVAAAVGLVTDLLSQARDIDDLQILVPALVAAAVVEVTRGAPRLALDLIEEIDRVTHERGGGQWYLGLYVAELARTCAAAQEPGLAERLIEHAPTHAARHRDAHLTARAVLTEARGAVDAAAQLYDQAAERWARYGHVLERGQALLGAGRCQLRLDRPHQARSRLEEARAIFRGLGARPLSAAADTCLLDTRAQRR